MDITYVKFEFNENYCIRKTIQSEYDVSAYNITKHIL